MQATALINAPWTEPVQVLHGLGEQAWTAGFLTGGANAGWSYVMADPDAVLSLSPGDGADAFAALARLGGPTQPRHPDGPPFQGGVAGLIAYDLADRLERLSFGRLDGWPDLACARYPAILAFDHTARRIVAVGRGADAMAADAQAGKALDWLSAARAATPGPIGAMTSDDGPAYQTAVADVIGRIAAGEIFQANIARRWTGRLAPGRAPADLLAALARQSPAPFAAYLRLPGRALVSNSPERFVRVVEGAVRTEPIKGTVPRGSTPAQDAALAARLAASQKDRAENLMIVDLMRNDLARVCAPGTVRAPDLFAVTAFANVHHLVSVVTGRLAPGRTAVDLLAAAFPPGSITGAPKVQAMKVIAGLEAPRGPFFGSMFHLGFDGALDSNVLIRTAALTQDQAGWAIEARAGAGVVADSDPAAERAETEAKISALLRALEG